MALTKKCFCLCPVPHALTPAGKTALAGTRAALLKDAFWGPRPQLTIGFLGGSAKLRKRVADAANLWISDGGAKVTFAFLTHPGAEAGAADIRIAFKPGDGSWSYLGNEAQNIGQGDPTMNFGWIDEESSKRDVESVVLHEFGHALGLIHEHQNPKKGIDWDRNAVIADLSGPPNNWDLETIEHNMFKKYEPKSIIATDTDKHSIMMYQIPEHWTKDDFHTGFNFKLSEKDKKLIQDAYF